jgi:hypothetical protein
MRREICRTAVRHLEEKKRNDAQRQTGIRLILILRIYCIGSRLTSFGDESLSYSNVSIPIKGSDRQGNGQLASILSQAVLHQQTLPPSATLVEGCECT